MARQSAIDRRILVVAPTGGDGKNVALVLEKAGFQVETTETVATAVEWSYSGCGVLLLTEEALSPAHRGVLVTLLSNQPAWSNLPLVFVTSGGVERVGQSVRRGFDARTHVTLLERPLRAVTLVAAIEAALGSRDQQYEIRDLLAEREKLLSSLEERVQERTATLQAMVQEMEAFSYSVSHDLRSPLRVISGYADAVREDHAKGLSPEGHQLLEKISMAAKRMDHLTQDVLAYTRISSGELVLEKIDLDEVIESVIDSYPELNEARQHICVQKPLGPCLGHSPSLAQCFSNLLHNAVKFSKPGQSPEIEVSSRVEGNKVRISVIDRGIGIDPKDHERIFGLFERIGSSVPGSGIGLAIAKKGAERMKDQVGLLSVKGKKTEFWIELNLHR